jgi:competence protein ComEC
MAAPLFLPTLGFIAGVTSSLFCNTVFSPFYLFSLTGLLAAGWLAWFIKKDRLALVITLAGFFALGWTLSAWKLDSHQRNELRSLPTGEYLDFRGRLLKSPERRQDRNLLTIKVSEVKIRGQLRKINGNLRLTVPHSATTGQPLELLVGDKLEFSAIPGPERTFRNFFPDFMPRYLRSQSIQARAFCKSPLLIKKVDDRNRTLVGFFSKLRRNLQKNIEKDFRAENLSGLSREGAVLEALLLGEDGRIDPETERQFQKSGLYHLLAISGAHVAVIAFLLYSLLGLFLRRKRTKHLILLATLIFYALLVEGQPSVFRAVIMASVFLIGKIIYADTNLLNTLSMSALILLLVHPFSLEEVGFQLTFLATLSLILFFEPIKRALPRLPLKISEMLALSTAAVVGTMPVIISNFNRVTFASLFLTLIAAPLVGLIMGAGYVYLIISSMLPSAGQAIALALKGLVKFFIWLTGVLEPLSSLSYRIPSPPLAVILGFYGFLFSFLLEKKFRFQRILQATGFLAFFLILITYPFKPVKHELTVTFMDVGQGDSVVVEFPDNRLLVLDAGGFPQSSFDPGESLVSPYLWHRGYKKIDYLISSHFHIDHVGGLPALLRNFRVKELWLTENDTGSHLEQELLKHLSSKTRRRLVRSGLVETPGKARIEVLYPEADSFSKFKPGNDRSAVIRLESGSLAFLLTGDISEEVESFLIKKKADSLRAEVLKVPHHGSRTSSSWPFLKVASPRWAVITAGQNNPYLPSAEVLTRLEEAGAKVFRTDLDGAIQFESSERGLIIRTAANLSSKKSQKSPEPK